MKVENSLVVVSRWYGGILMGGARWVAINRAASELCDELGLRNGGKDGGGAGPSGGAGGKETKSKNKKNKR